MPPLVAFAVAVVFGGSNYVAVRYSNDALAPFWGAGLRTAIAGMVLLITLAVLRIRFPRGPALRGALVYGVLGFGVAMAFGYWGLLRAPAGLASVLTSLAPLLTIAVATAHGLERFNRARALGAIVAALGVAIVFADQLGQDVPLVSQLAVIVSILCFCEATVLLKLSPGSHPVATNAVGMAAGAAFLVVMAALTGEPMFAPPNTITWVAVLYLVVGSILLFSSYLYVASHWDASSASFAFVLFPLVAVSTGALLRGELVGPSFFVGAALIVAGVYYGAIRTQRYEGHFSRTSPATSSTRPSDSLPP